MKQLEGKNFSCQEIQEKKYSCAAVRAFLLYVEVKENSISDFSYEHKYQLENFHINMIIRLNTV